MSGLSASHLLWEGKLYSPIAAIYLYSVLASVKFIVGSHFAGGCILIPVKEYMTIHFYMRKGTFSNTQLYSLGIIVVILMVH